MGRAYFLFSTSYRTDSVLFLYVTDRLLCGLWESIIVEHSVKQRLLGRIKSQ